MRVRVLATPGHTFTHLAYVLAARTGAGARGVHRRVAAVRLDRAAGPARPRHAGELAHAQSRLGAPAGRRAAGPDAEVYPTHGFGSFCAATQVEASSSTIGRERRVNPVLTLAEDRYVRDLLAGLDAYPAYYAHMGPANAAGPAGADLSPPRRADAAELRRRIDAGEWVVDLRARRAFAAGHVAGTLSFDLDGSFATYLGWLIPWGTPLTLLGQTPEQVAEAQRELVRIGIDRPAAAATGHPGDWPAAGRCAATPSRTSPPWKRSGATVRCVVLDVRRDQEWDASHISGAVHIPAAPAARPPGRGARGRGVGALRGRIPRLGRRVVPGRRGPDGRRRGRRVRPRRRRGPADRDDEYARAARAGLPIDGHLAHAAAR